MKLHDLNHVKLTQRSKKGQNKGQHKGQQKSQIIDKILCRFLVQQQESFITSLRKTYTNKRLLKIIYIQNSVKYGSLNTSKINHRRTCYDDYQWDTTQHYLNYLLQ